MNMNCRLSDAITRIKNAKRNDYPCVKVLWSQKNYAVLSVLKENGIAVDRLEVVSVDKEGSKLIEPELMVHLRRGKLHALKVLSTPGRVMHVNKKKIPVYKNHLGLVVVSTSSGMMTGAEATAKGIGGKLMVSAF